MLTNVRETSINCFHAHAAQFETQESQIFDWICTQKTHPTRREISKALNIDASSVSGRVNALINTAKTIEEAGKRKCTVTGITAQTLRVVPSQKDLF